MLGEAMRFATVCTVAFAICGKANRGKVASSSKGTTEVLEHRFGQETNFEDHLSTTMNVSSILMRKPTSETSSFSVVGKLAAILALSSALTSADAFASPGLQTAGFRPFQKDSNTALAPIHSNNPFHGTPSGPLHASIDPFDGEAIKEIINVFQDVPLHASFDPSVKAAVQDVQAAVKDSQGIHVPAVQAAVQNVVAATKDFQAGGGLVDGAIDSYICADPDLVSACQGVDEAVRSALRSRPSGSVDGYLQMAETVADDGSRTVVYYLSLSAQNGCERIDYQKASSIPKAAWVEIRIGVGKNDFLGWEEGGAYVMDLFVAPALQGLRLGTMLMELAAHWSEKAGATQLVLYDGTSRAWGPENLYSQIGFKPVEPYWTESGGEDRKRRAEVKTVLGKAPGLRPKIAESDAPGNDVENVAVEDDGPSLSKTTGGPAIVFQE